MKNIGHWFSWITVLSLCFEDSFSSSFGTLMYLMGPSLHFGWPGSSLPILALMEHLIFYNQIIREHSFLYIISVNYALSLLENSLGVLQFEYIWKADRGQCIILLEVPVRKRAEGAVRRHDILSCQVWGQAWSDLPEDKHLASFHLPGFHVSLTLFCYSPVHWLVFIPDLLSKHGMKSYWSISVTEVTKSQWEDGKQTKAQVSV